MVKTRKRDAHEKIQLGGLIVKAGLRDLDKSVILGALLEVADVYQSKDDTQIKAWASKGNASLTADTKVSTDSLDK